MSRESEKRLAEEVRQAKEAAEKAKQEAAEEARQAKEAAEKAKQEAIKSLENSVLGNVGRAVGDSFGKSQNESEQKAFDQHEKGKAAHRAANCIIAVILLAVIGSCFGGGNDKNKPSKQETVQTQQIKQEPPKTQTGEGNQDPVMKILNGEPTEQEKLDQEKAIRAEAEKKAKEEQAKQQGEQRARAWCSKMRILMDDADEQWAYWWPIATGSHDIVTGYDAANTLNLNLKQCFDSFNGSNYEIPLNATEAQKSQMKEIKKKFSDSLWKRVKASEKYSKALRSGIFDLKEAEGIRRRAIEADSTAAQASSLLSSLESSLGMERGATVSSDTSGGEEEGRVTFNIGN